MTRRFPLEFGQCLIAVVAMMALAATSWGQGLGQGKTADELYLAAVNAYNSGQYAEAVAGFQQFATNYGASEQGKEAMGAIRYPLAMSLLHLQKFDEAMGAITDALDSEPKPTADQRENLLFYKAVCELQGESLEAARGTLAEFVQQFPQAAQFEEALMLAGTTYLLEGKNAEAAEHFAGIRPRLNPVNRGRAAVLELYALLAEGDTEAALALVVEEFPRMDEMLQVATFQTLALQLGAGFLDEGHYRKAIMCLQRVWSSDRILDYQRKRLDDLEDALAAAEAQPQSDPYRKFQLKQMIGKIKRELESFGKIESFDAALRLRLATAFQAMERYRESALILEEMLADLPPDPVVESASVNLVQSWMAIERWPKVVAASEAFAEKFPKSDQLPTVRYLEGIALQRLNEQDRAIEVFRGIVENYPDSELAPRAYFMEGFSQLLAEQNAEAVATFSEFPRKYSEHELKEAAAYWRGMGYSLGKQFPETREAMDAYLAAYPEGAFRGAAEFRKAYAAQSMKDYGTSIGELNAYLAKYPDHESGAEALLLLGDAYMAEGEIEKGIAAFKRIPPDEVRFFEEGWFKTGKALRLLEDVDGMRAHFAQFRTEHPRSPRVAEAVYWIGWTHRNQDEPEKAREAYWAAIGEMGNDPSIRSVDDLFPVLSKLYKGDEQAQYYARLRDLREEADAADQDVLGMRALWAQAHAIVKTEPAKAQATMLEAAARADVTSTNSLLLADFASAYEAERREEDAERTWRDLVKWNPRAPQKDRAFAALGHLELRRGNEKAALGWFDRFEKETFNSTQLGPVLLAKARLLETRGQYDEARAALEKLLSQEYVSGQQKAEALFAIGESYMKQDKPELAVPYFQKIYIMYGRWSDWVAKAYVRSGEAFEQLENTEAARKTYDEMTKLESMAQYPETTEARERLDALGGPIETPTQPAEEVGES